MTAAEFSSQLPLTASAPFAGPYAMTKFIPWFMKRNDPVYELSIYNWVPVNPIYFHSGNSDNIVPHFNSTEAYQALKELGGKVTLYEYSGDHYTPVLDYYAQMLTDFDKLIEQ